jgi:drug/metabolite transporter (DMT)-like permease
VSRALKAHTLLVLVTFVWGTTFVLIKYALADISPLLFNAIRMVLAAVAMVAVYHRELPRFTRGSLRAGALVGLFLFLGYEFQTTGLVHTTPSKSAFLTGVSVVLVPIFLAVGFRRPVNRWIFLGVGSAFVGLYLLTVPASEAGALLHLEGVNRGDLLTLGCAVCFALHIIFMGRAMRRHPFSQVAIMQMAVAAVLMTPSAPLLESIFVRWSPEVVWAILITGLLGSAAAFTVQAWAQQFMPPTHTALIFALEPVFAWVTSYFVLRERLGWRGGIGALFILAGILVSELKGSKGEMEAEVGDVAAPPADNETPGTRV